MTGNERTITDSLGVKPRNIKRNRQRAEKRQSTYTGAYESFVPRSEFWWGVVPASNEYWNCYGSMFTFRIFFIWHCFWTLCNVFKLQILHHKNLSTIVDELSWLIFFSQKSARRWLSKILSFLFELSFCFAIRLWHFLIFFCFLSIVAFGAIMKSKDLPVDD